MKIIFYFLFAAVVFTGCSNLSAEKPKTNQPEGQAIYYSKCGGCHRIYEREKLTPVQWEHELVDMKKRAKLNDEQAQKVFLYLSEKSVDTTKN